MGLQQLQFLTTVLKGSQCFPLGYFFACLNNPLSKIVQHVFMLCSGSTFVQLCEPHGLQWKFLWTAVAHHQLYYKLTLERLRPGNHISLLTVLPFCISLTQSGHYWDFDLLSEAPTTSQCTLQPRSIVIVAGMQNRASDNVGMIIFCQWVKAVSSLVIPFLFIN